ncbi:MAG: AMP-binding protein [Planctomycetaceae bacterium]|nr:AMP-binding protein [Planctomycetaceae bacterium]
MSHDYLLPPRRMIRACRNHPYMLKLADSTGKELNGIDTLVNTMVIRRLLRKILDPSEQNVGLLFPGSVYGALVNAAITMDRRVAVNLNYTFNAETLNYCIKKAEIKHVITTKRFLERFPDLKLDAQLIVLEDCVKQVSLFDKLCGWFDAKLMPLPILEWKLGLTKIRQDDPISIIFTSGSTGTPKGVCLSHRNIAANTEGFKEHLLLVENDRILGILPFFHSFGYTTTIWIALVGPYGAVYHFNPLDPKKVGEMARKYAPSLLPSTATFQRSYLRRCPKEDFEKVATVVCGAEKVPLNLIEAWKEKYGTTLVEGYGTTELSPVVSVNINEARRSDYADWLRVGTVGRPLPGIQARVLDLDNGTILPPNSPGMLQIKGDNAMLGYYKEPEKTAEVLKDGWYTTGDVAKIDEDGFIWITGRESRMSKIGGEMVPHILIEEMIDRIVRAELPNEDEGGVLVAVVGLPDEKKGEKVIVLHRPLPLTPDEICKRMQSEGLPNLWIPLPQHFYPVESIPVLGTGKLDLRATKEMAQQYQ